ncbi:hypothetical protein BH11PAT1_BH11PAT1_6920 [soil metagenome]
MNEFFQKLFIKYPNKSRRSLEILPGLVAWSLIISPLWAAFLIPTPLAYFILFFDVYWFYKSFSLVIFAHIATNRIKVAEKIDWYAKAKELPHFQKIDHILIIPNYKELPSKLRLTINHLTKQKLPLEHLHIVLGIEEREGESGRERAELFIKEYKGVFGSIFATYHPDVIGEVKGKGSNEAYAGKEAYEKLFIKGKLDLNYATVSSVDADSMFDPEYFAYITYDFLINTRPYNVFWQSANVFYNNIWQVPAPTRIISFFGSLCRTALLVQGDRLITNSTYTLSFKLLKDIDFWDADVIPEDYRIFFKAFFRTKGKVWVEPVFLKTSMDAAQSATYIGSLKNKYQQEQRWAWGVSDDPLFMQWWLTIPGLPFFRKTSMLYHVMLDHILWPVNWFIITIAANVIPLINPEYTRTSLGYSLPKIAGFLLTTCMVSIVAMIIIDIRNRPESKHVPMRKKILFPLEFMLMPFVGFFLSALPALISHTQLMFGKRLEYKVTEKV